MLCSRCNSIFPPSNIMQGMHAEGVESNQCGHKVIPTEGEFSRICQPESGTFSTRERKIKIILTRAHVSESSSLLWAFSRSRKVGHAMQAFIAFFFLD